MPSALQLLEGGDGISKRMRPSPVEKIAIEAVGPEPLERPLAGGDRPIPRSVVRQDLGDEENLIAPPGDRRADQCFSVARTVHLGGVDMRHAEIETPTQSGYRHRGIRLLDIPGSLADDCDFALCRTERALFHGLLFAVAGSLWPLFLTREAGEGDRA